MEKLVQMIDGILPDASDALAWGTDGAGLRTIVEDARTALDAAKRVATEAVRLSQEAQNNLTEATV